MTLDMCINMRRAEKKLVRALLTFGGEWPRHPIRQVLLSMTSSPRTISVPHAQVLLILYSCFVHLLLMFCFHLPLVVFMPLFMALLCCAH